MVSRFILFQFCTLCEIKCSTITIDMSFENAIHIRLPKQPKIIVEKTAIIPIHNSASRYEIYPASSRFDPNMANSPPDQFVEHLKNRMDAYYSGSLNMQLHFERARDRANSFEVLLRTHRA